MTERDRQPSIAALGESLELIGFPRASAARLLGISPAWLSRVLNGRDEPSPDLREAIMELNARLLRSGLVELAAKTAS